MDDKYEGWSIVELMGHQTLAGYVSEQVVAGSSFIRIDVPEIEVESGATVGTKLPGFTKLYGASAIYGITPTTEETVKVAAVRLDTRPVDVWVVPGLPEPSVFEGEEPF